jgi:hypothetical protein
VRPIVPLPARPLVPAPPGPVTGGPTPTPSIVTSAPRPGAPAPRASQPTLAHAVPPMPQIDSPPAQLRAETEADGRLDAAMRETDFITAVEIDAEAKAAAKATRSHEIEGAGSEEATGIGEPPIHEGPVVARTASEERAAMTADARGNDSDAVETAGREGIDMDAPSPAGAASAPGSRSTPAPRIKPPLSTAPPSLPPPKTANIPATGPTPACPQCEAPMAWVEEHLRFYCKSCRMYF